MAPIVLKNKSPTGIPLEAVFLPDIGMNMASYKKGGVEVIDQSTKAEFEERFAGLGPLIGPHFHRRKPEIIPPIADESLFPHIARVKAKGIKDPFSHGISRYAPWKAEFTETSIKGILTGKDTWNNIPLAELEGQNFKMTFDAELTPKGLKIHLSVVSDKDSLVGIHYYYRLPKGEGKVVSSVKEHYLDNTSAKKKIPPEWSYSHKILTFDLHSFSDYTFYPYPDPIHGEIMLETSEYRLMTAYSCNCQENSWQLYHPEGASFVCIEPNSSQDPRHPNLTASHLAIHLDILE